MKVCIVSDGLPFDHGGAQLRAFRHSQELQAAEGTGAMLIAWDRSAKRMANSALPANVHPVKLHFQDVGGTQTPIRPAKLLLHLVELVARLWSLLFGLRRSFDILHVINAASWFSLMTVPLAKLLKKPVIIEMVLLGADDPLELNKRSNHPDQQLYPHRPLKYSLFLQADAYVSKSHAVSEAYRHAGLPDAKLFQIPSGVDAEEFGPPTPEEKQSLRHKLGLVEGDIIILFIGLISERKGVRRLLAAIRQIAPSHPEVHLLVVGPSRLSEETYLQAVYQDIAAWGLSERVTLVDEMVENVDEFMKAADIFVLPTSREGLSVAILEAMSSGLAVVASDIPEIARSQIRHEEEGLLVPVGDTTKLADAITELIRDASLRARLGHAARQRVLREFTLEIQYRRYLSLYKRLICEASTHD